MLKSEGFIVLTVLVSLNACVIFNDETIEDKIVVSAFGKNLLLDSLCSRIPNELSFEDSTLLSERIIEGWVRENVLLAQAEKNINEFSSSFESSIRSYRNALLVTQFEREFIASRVDTKVQDEEIEKFHSDYPELFQLKEHVLRAVFFEINTEEDMLDSARIWLTTADSSSVPKLEQWSIEHGAHFALDVDYWWFLSDLLQTVPIQVYRIEDQLRDRRLIEFTDGDSRYLLRILEHRLKDLPSPIPIARKRIVDLIIQERRRSILENLRDDLVSDAWANGEIIRDSILN
ncbi:MAG: hypothetical protein HOM41_03620 [Flavobacteriales bacterium]|jgi:hypothetical protein|nr:hypothetical protein [Flavobacteriales bacterium]MBT6174461.1 hypothetical protein [Flavobacteriales bacterium]